LYALGVTACRLLTGEYPEPADPFQDEHGLWHLQSVMVPPAFLEIDPRLRSFIVRLLSVRPEKRGTAAQLVQALEQVSALSLTDSPQPLLAEPPRVVTPIERQSSAERVSPRARRRQSPPWMAATAAVLALAAWVWWLSPRQPAEKPSFVQREAGSAGQQDGGTAGLGEVASMASLEDSLLVCLQESLAEETPPEPDPDQARPDAKGRCPHKGQVALNGGCWAPLQGNSEECEAASGQMFKGKCYMPALPPRRRQPTSHPTPKP
jgi:serine/threonine protein kinase